MSTSIINQIESVGTKFKLAKNTQVFQEGDNCESFVLITNGTIKVYKVSEHGRELVLYRVSPDQLCVLTTSCMLANNTYNANGITETEVTGFSLTKEDFDKLVINSVDFRELIFTSLSNRFNSFVEKIDEVVFHTLKERLLDFLINNKDQNNEVNITHQTLASELGTEREVISRLVSQLKKNNIIESRTGVIRLIS